MPRVILEELRQLAVSQAPGHASRFVLRWKDALGQDEAVAILERDHETVRMAYRWRKDERWSTVRQELTLQVARTATGGVYRMWRCPHTQKHTKEECSKAARRLYEAPRGGFTCRRCVKAVHRCQGEPVMLLALHQAVKIRTSLGGSPDLSQPFPKRPKSMRQAAYRQLRAEALRLQAVSAGVWCAPGARKSAVVRVRKAKG